MKNIKILKIANAGLFIMIETQYGFSCFWNFVILIDDSINKIKQFKSHKNLFIIR